MDGLREKYAPRMAQFHNDEQMDIFLDDPNELRNATATLPPILSSVAHAVRDDNIAQTATRLEEQAIARSHDAGVKTAVSLKRQRSKVDSGDDDEEWSSDNDAAVVAMEAVPEIEDFSEYEFPDNDPQNQELHKRMEQLNEVREPVSIESTLKYVFSLEDKRHGRFFEASQQRLIHAGIKKWEKIPVWSRAAMRPFWRECDPHIKWERPCSRADCESVRAHGFRCREFYSDAAEWAAVVSSHGKSLPVNIGWCLPCHYLVSGRLFLSALNRFLKDPEAKDMQQIYRVHDFAVQVDVVGEYKLSCTLIEHDLPRDIYAKLKGRQLPFVGMFGLFPIYNVHNYVAVKTPVSRGTMVNALRESDAVVFQEAQPVSDAIESCPITPGDQANRSIPSDLIGSRVPRTRT